MYVFVRAALGLVVQRYISYINDLVGYGFACVWDEYVCHIGFVHLQHEEITVMSKIREYYFFDTICSRVILYVENSLSDETPHGR